MVVDGVTQSESTRQTEAQNQRREESKKVEQQIRDEKVNHEQEKKTRASQEIDYTV